MVSVEVMPSVSQVVRLDGAISQINAAPQPLQFGQQIVGTLWIDVYLIEKLGDGESRRGQERQFTGAEGSKLHSCNILIRRPGYRADVLPCRNECCTRVPRVIFASTNSRIVLKFRQCFS